MASIKFLQSINPATEEIMGSYALHSKKQIEEKLRKARDVFISWRSEKYSARSDLMKAAAGYLREHKSRFARIMTSEGPVCAPAAGYGRKSRRGWQ